MCPMYGLIKCWLQVFTAVSRAQCEGIKVGLMLLVCDLVFLTSEFLCVCVCVCVYAHTNKYVSLVKCSALPSHLALDLLSLISLILTPEQT